MKNFRSLSIVAALAGLLMAGCSTTMGHVSIKPIKPAYKSQESMRKFDRPAQKLIRVAQFEDKRPKAEHDGHSPMLLINTRRGVYVTSDEAWSDGSVQQNVTQAVADGLKDSNFFEQVQVENAAAPTGGSGFILKGTIDSFGSEEQVSYYEWLILSQDNYWTPKGRCRLTYTLIDAETGQDLLHNTVNGESASNKLDITENGVAALNTAVTLLTKEIAKGLTTN